MLARYINLTSDQLPSTLMPIYSSSAQPVGTAFQLIPSPVSCQHACSQEAAKLNEKRQALESQLKAVMSTLDNSMHHSKQHPTHLQQDYTALGLHRSTPDAALASRLTHQELIERQQQVQRQRLKERERIEAQRRSQDLTGFSEVGDHSPLQDDPQAQTPFPSLLQPTASLQVPETPSAHRPAAATAAVPPSPALPHAHHHRHTSLTSSFYLLHTQPSNGASRAADTLKLWREGQMSKDLRVTLPRDGRHTDLWESHFAPATPDRPSYSRSPSAGPETPPATNRVDAHSSALYQGSSIGVFKRHSRPASALPQPAKGCDADQRPHTSGTPQSHAEELSQRVRQAAEKRLQQGAEQGWDKYMPASPAAAAAAGLLPSYTSPSSPDTPAVADKAQQQRRKSGKQRGVHMYTSATPTSMHRSPAETLQSADGAAVQPDAEWLALEAKLLRSLDRVSAAAATAAKVYRARPPPAGAPLTDLPGTAYRPSSSYSTPRLGPQSGRFSPHEQALIDKVNASTTAGLDKQLMLDPAIPHVHPASAASASPSAGMQQELQQLKAEVRALKQVVELESRARRAGH
jgi:hypothetical protein